MNNVAPGVPFVLVHHFIREVGKQLRVGEITIVEDERRDRSSIRVANPTVARCRRLVPEAIGTSCEWEASTKARRFGNCGQTQGTLHAIKRAFSVVELWRL